MKNTKKLGLGVLSILALAGCENSLSGAEKAALSTTTTVAPTTIPASPTTAPPVASNTGPGGAEVTCLVVLPDADTQPDGYAQLVEIYGDDIDYTDDSWVDISSGAIIGYADHEDSIIWNYPECTGPGQNYFDELNG